MKILAIVFTSRRKDRPASLQVTEEICRLASEHGGGDAEIEIDARPAFAKADARQTKPTAWLSCGKRCGNATR